jgi:N-acetylneuraminic acid mutarotase
MRFLRLACLTTGMFFALACLTGEWTRGAIAQEREMSPLKWVRRASLPDPQGFAGMIAGVSHGQLVAAGGANFPDLPPWKNGKKIWYDRIFVVKTPQGAWEELPARLPRPLAYSCVVSWQDALIVAGGESSLPDGSRPCDEVFSLEIVDGGVRIQDLPGLPAPLTNASGVRLGSYFYIVGGIHTPQATQAEQTCYRMDLSLAPEARHWETLPPLPGFGRMLAPVAAVDEALFVFSGAALSSSGTRVQLLDCYRLDASLQWTRLAKLQSPVVAAPSPAPSDGRHIFLLGGDDGTQLKTDPDSHPGFPMQARIYNVKEDRYEASVPMPVSRVTVPLVEWNGGWFLISGEMRPGVRSPEVWELMLSSRP